MRQILYCTMIVVLIGIASCVPCKYMAKRCPPVIKDSVVYTETVTDNPNYTIPDSVYWTLQFECDSNYNVLLQDFNEVNSGLITDVKVKEVVKTVVDKKAINTLTLYLKVKSDSIQSLNKTIEKLKSTVKTVVVEKIVIKNKVPKWCWYLLIANIVIVIVIVGWIYLKNKAKILGLFK